ncbi:hypothetical protein K9M79_07345 [Candidatus Woesearchaeota archaeon]|nr:hypothetical protein [Candidatus Woesearchaeota archaeon]
MTRAFALCVFLLLLIGCQNPDMVPQPLDKSDGKTTGMQTNVQEGTQNQDSVQDNSESDNKPIVDEVENDSKSQNANLPDPCLDAYDKPTCYMDYALEINDKSFCEKADYKSNECYDSFILKDAVETRDKLLCVDIINDDIKEVCYYKVRNN